jgi:hypothetical protein
MTGAAPAYAAPNPGGTGLPSASRSPNTKHPGGEGPASVDANLVRPNVSAHTRMLILSSALDTKRWQRGQPARRDLCDQG